MFKLLSIAILFLVIHTGSVAQVWPAEGVKLNYRIIGFSWLPTPAHTYKIEIAEGDFTDEVAFRKNIIKTVHAKTARVVAEVPSFNKNYTWRVLSEQQGKPGKTGSMNHFSCPAYEGLDTNRLRLRIVTEASQYQDAYILSDGARAIYDMKGNLVWYLPGMGKYLTPQTLVNDFRTTPEGTFTFLVEEREAYEINYNGDILWKSPPVNTSGGSISYHHEFTKTDKGHYMVMGAESIYIKPNPVVAPDTSLFIFPALLNAGDSFATGPFYEPFTTLLEYDRDGIVVWKWCFTDYFKTSDLNYFCPANMHHNSFDAHANSFFFDQQNNFIYMSLRNINRLIKIKYPEGNVVSVYGEIYSAQPETGNSLFSGQHTISKTMNGSLLLYDNEVCHMKQLTKVVQLEEPLSHKGKLKMVWEYACTMDGINDKTAKVPGYTRGGSVAELPDHSVFVSMNVPFSKVFIASRDKRIIWCGVFEAWNQELKCWRMIPQYRANIILGKKEMERLIWNSETAAHKIGS